MSCCSKHASGGGGKHRGGMKTMLFGMLVGLVLGLMFAPKPGSETLNANDKASYMIYNDQQKKSWVVNGDTAVESSGADNPGTSFNPATMLSAFAYLPSTNQSGDTWEFNLPGAGKLTMEFKGPEGLPSLMTQEDTSGKKTVTEFKYTNVGNVKASMFEMPGNVKMMSGPGTNTIMVPGGTGTSSSSMMNP